mmetsp:Transcript_127112/g.245038  ORF Transcript_127112/g.245038 Transcript_127112/m.245038 type:complete len:859 (-) Transcript_127112:10-2586(-)
MDVVWIRRDARLQDNAALSAGIHAASQNGGSLCILYVFDPRWITGPHCHASHCQFVSDGLQEFAESLGSDNPEAGVLCRHESTETALQALHQTAGCVARLWSHRLVGDAENRAIDTAVSKWCKDSNVEWKQLDQYGLVQGGRLQEGKSVFAKEFEKVMTAEPLATANIAQSRFCRLPEGWKLNDIPRGNSAWAKLGASGRLRIEAPRGGERLAQEVLHSFLNHRGKDYAKGLSSPGTAWTACSRLSAYLAWGHISLRSVIQATAKRQSELRSRGRSKAAKVDPMLDCEGSTITQDEATVDDELLCDADEPAIKSQLPLDSEREQPQPPADASWLRSLQHFQSRLRWRTHFMQKLADDPEFDVNNMCRGYDGMRNEDPSHLTADEQTRLQAWLGGCTGYPLVDACMRALHKSGWINFRMRCMLVSFAAYDLWLSWKCFGPSLAQLFIDYEPGIHYPQIQMQSGTTGINSNRIYDPNKQVLDHDQHGHFIRRYVPELSEVPDGFLSKPWKIHLAAYPRPVVDHTRAVQQARSNLLVYNRTVKGKGGEGKAIFEKHGSRRPNAGDLNTQVSGAPIKRARLSAPEEAASVAALASECSAGPLKVELAKSGRASCRLCGQNIPPRSGRCGLETKYRGRLEIRWCHAECFLRKCIRATYCRSIRGGHCRSTGVAFQKDQIVVRCGIGDSEVPFSIQAAAVYTQAAADTLDLEVAKDAIKDWGGAEEDDALTPFVKLSAEDRRIVCAKLLPSFFSKHDVTEFVHVGSTAQERVHVYQQADGQQQEDKKEMCNHAGKCSSEASENSLNPKHKDSQFSKLVCEQSEERGFKSQMQRTAKFKFSNGQVFNTLSSLSRVRNPGAVQELE